MNHFDRLNEIVALLRDPEKGCPWDLKQTPQTLVPNMIEELYEVVEAIGNTDITSWQEELGDLMLHIVMQVRLAEEQQAFRMEDVLDTINQKLIRRHPHIFGDHESGDADQIKKNWEIIKKEEKRHTRQSVLEGIPEALPALIKASRTQEKAAAVGFDWPDLPPILEKLDEEREELLEALEEQDHNHITEEIGDLLFTVVNLARKLHIDAEAALNQTTRKFKTRFNKIENHYRDLGIDMQNESLEALDLIWEKVKRDES